MRIDSLLPVLCASLLASSSAPALAHGSLRAERLPTATPIKHLVVIFDENVSFDHYFATYPKAANPPGEPRFTAAPHTPRVNNLVAAHLLTRTPNFPNKANAPGAAEPRHPPPLRTSVLQAPALSTLGSTAESSARTASLWGTVTDAPPIGRRSASSANVDRSSTGIGM